MVIERACARLGWDLARAALRRPGLRQRRRDRRDRARTSKGATVVAVSDVSGGVSRPGRARHPDAARVRRASTARSRGSPARRAITNAELLELPCDVLVLAAREDQVTAENAGSLRCRLVAEGANGPTSVDADAILAERGIPVLPDVLTNAGGVTVSYFEWVQDLGRLFWDRDEIRRRLAEKLGDAFDRVWSALRAGRHLAARRGARRRDPRGLCGARSARDVPVSASGGDRGARDAMVTEPLALDGAATAQEAGEALARPEVRAVLVLRRGAARRRGHAQDARARGRRRRPRPADDAAA